MEKNQFALESFKNIQELIRFIDQKAGAALVLAGLILTSFLEHSKKVQFISFQNVETIGWLCFISGFITLFFVMLVFYCSIFKVLKPRLAQNYSKDEYSLFYFEHLEKMGKEKTIRDYQVLDENIMLKNIIDQQYEISKIMVKKTRNLGYTFNLLVAAFIFFYYFF